LATLPAPASAPAGAAVAAFGLLPSSVPLASLLPQSAPGCALQVVPDLTMVVCSQTRFAGFDLAVPPLPGLSGLQFHEQVVVLDVTGTAGITGAASTDRLTFTVGSHQ
jgi:hypothetical protein